MKEFFDFNIHPNINFLNSKLLNKQIASEFNCTNEDLLISFNKFHDDLSIDIKQKLKGINIMLFSKFFQDNPILLSDFILEIKKIFFKSNIKISVTTLIDPRNKDFKVFIDYCALSSVNFIKFHCYHQHIDSKLFENCVRISKYAEKKNIGICVDTSFGTRGLYKFDNLRLASEIFEEINKVPVVLLHLGGIRALEAALLVADTANGFLETSFTPKYFENFYFFNTIKDALKLVGSKRIIYASDYPYISIDESLESSLKLFNECNFFNDELDNILFGNALKIMQKD